jgi:Ca-activated chloride channel family protein
MFQFEHPYFIILLALPYLIYWLAERAPAQEEDSPTIITPNHDRIMQAFSKNTGSSKVRTKFNWLLFWAWAMCVLALMHPQNVNRIKKIVTEGYDIMLAVDLSGSMRALDFASKSASWNRLDIVKSVAAKFISEREGDRIGLILFGNNAYLQSPLSLDLNSTNEMLKMSQIGLAGDATAIGDAITLGVKNLRERPEGSRVMILMTDGDDTASKVPPMEAARLARDYGIKIYTIGVGKKGPVPYPTPSGAIIYTPLEINDDMLKRIAETTGGKFFHATNKDALETIYDEINRLEKTEAETKEMMMRDQLFFIPLSFGLFLLSVAFLTKFKWGRLFGQ